MRVLIVGDTHGNADWLRRYIYPVALTTGADRIVVLGDFGAWEHTPAGVDFMDEVNGLGIASRLPLFWLHGNHDKFSHTLQHYGDDVDRDGFIEVRDFVFYIPQGHTWSWAGVDFRAFGGAYSVDKVWRIQAEQQRYLKALRASNLQASFSRVRVPAEATSGTLWFPEEEMTDAEMSALIEADSSPKHVVLSHDKPYSSKPSWNRKDIPGCIPNQLRLERALRAHWPQYWLHGHLHYHYVDHVHRGGRESTVIGLEPDDEAAEPGWKQIHTWALADCDDTKITVKLGRDVFLDPEVLQRHVSDLG